MAVGVGVTALYPDTLKDTLSEIVDDDTDGLEAKMQLRMWMTERTMEDAYEDDLEVFGMGLLSEKTEMQSITVGQTGQGSLFRYMPTAFAGKLIYSREVMRDVKYDQVLKPAKRLKRACIKTIEVDTQQMLVRGFNTSYPYGDGVELFSTAQPLPGGGTFSNEMATPQSPSTGALIALTSQMRKTASHDGIDEMYEPECVLCPTEQWAVWDQVLGSPREPAAGEFNAINVVNRIGGLKKKAVALTYWNNTTTNWAVLTDADDGPQIRWRDKMESNDWFDNDNMVLNYSIYVRFAWGLSNKRAIFGVQA